MTPLVFLVPGLPLIGAFVNALFGRLLPRRAIGFVAVTSVALAFLIALLEFGVMIGLPPQARVDPENNHQLLYSWIAVGDFQVNVGFLFDPLSAVMLLVVTGVGALIHLYSIGYMADDSGYARFFTYMNLFVFSMLLLVLADNYLLMYVGWELVGLCSYLLIGFWFTRDAARSAAVKAFVTNRVGDFGFALGLILIFWTFGTLNYSDVFSRALALSGTQGLSLSSIAGPPVITVITLLLFMGATGKSAQIPLYVWLPDAMEGPTPVSALIHAATMVTAGVYMVARSHVLFSLAPFSSEVVAVIGTLTALFAASIALVQTDLKRLLAYSTISQLGYMFMAVGVGAYAAGIFHLMTHAFFKALLFLGAGSVMHAMNNVIDMRQLGGLGRVMRITCYTFIAGGLALAGFPLFSGFFSKDEILSSAFFSGNYLLWLAGLLTAGLTAFYIFRGVFLTFAGAPRWTGVRSVPDSPSHSDSDAAHIAHGLHPHESPLAMTVPLLVLAGLSIIGGYVGLPAGLGANLFERFLDPVFGEGASAASHAASLEWLVICLSTAAAIVGIGLAYWFYVLDTSIPVYLANQYRGLYSLLANKYYVDHVYDVAFVRTGRWLAEFLAQTIDQRFIDGAANGLAGLFRNISRGLRLAESGYARAYALAMLAGTVIVIAALVIR